MIELFDQLRALELPPNDYVIFGSGPLVVRGVIEQSNDLDVVCRGAAWQAVCRLAPPEPDPHWGVELVNLCDGRLSFGSTWAVGDVDVDEIVDNAETIDGLPFAPLDYVVDYKRILGRPKDLEHLEALDRFTRGAS